MTIETGDSVSLKYVRALPDGTVFDTSHQGVAEVEGLVEAQSNRDYKPLAVEVSAGIAIEGLDEALADMSVGNGESIEIPPKKAYGEYGEDPVREYETEQLREVPDDKPEEDLYVQIQQGGLGKIIHTNDDMVRIDFNHELMGEALIFDVKILDANWIDLNRAAVLRFDPALLLLLAPLRDSIHCAPGKNQDRANARDAEADDEHGPEVEVIDVRVDGDATTCVLSFDERRETIHEGVVCPWPVAGVPIRGVPEDTIDRLSGRR